MVSWNPEILNKCVAPKISEFTSMELSDLNDEFPQSSFWLQNHFLNSNPLRKPFNPPFKQMAVNIIQKAHYIFHEYNTVRELSEAYLKGNSPTNPKLSSYYILINHCSNIFIHYCSIVEACNQFNKKLGSSAKAFEKNDGSVEQRMYEIGNCIKHVSSCIESGICTNDHTLSVWLTNTGFESFEISVTFTEFEGAIRDVGKFADSLVDPLSFVSQLTEEQPSEA